MRLAGLRWRGGAAGQRPARRRRVPTVLQMEAVECGAASLAMVLASFGRHVPLEQLRIACGVSRDGSKASNVLKAARANGLLAKGYRKEADKVAELPMPQIVFWNFNHYLVLEGFRGDRVYLNDPGEGPRTVSMEEFTGSFTGVTMVFERGPDFAPLRHEDPWLPLLRRLPGLGPGLVFLLVATLGLVLPGLVIPALSRIFFDNVLLGEQRYWVRPLLWSFAATALVRGGLTWLQQTALLQLENSLSVSGASRFVWHVLRLPAEFFAQRWPGDISQRVQINYKLAQLVCSDLATNIANALVLVFYAALLLRYDVAAALLGIGLAGVNLLALKLLQERQRDAARKLEKAVGKLVGATTASISMLETFKATGAEDESFSTWAGYQAAALNAAQHAGRTSILLAELPVYVAAATTALVLWLGGRRVMEGFLSMGALIALQALMGLFQEPVAGLVQLGSKLQKADADLARIDDVMRYPVQASPRSEAAHAVERVKGVLELDGVTFGYSPLEPPLLDGVSLRLEPGESLALVGGSGSGKSTVARLVCGLYPPWSGEIRFDGHSRETLGSLALANSFACVDQEIVLFEGTVRENLTLWDDDIPDAWLVRAAEDAAIYEDILRLPGGLNARIEEGGRNLSGGQRQRMEIARALVREPRILVLDEATSALDPMTEKHIVDALRRRGCTCLIVAHRLSTIRDCNTIVMLERGRILEQGRHEELAARGGAYARLMVSA